MLPSHYAFPVHWELGTPARTVLCRTERLRAKRATELQSWRFVVDEGAALRKKRNKRYGPLSEDRRPRRQNHSDESPAVSVPCYWQTNHWHQARRCESSRTHSHESRFRRTAK